jgi:hypothetical protein
MEAGSLVLAGRNELGALASFIADRVDHGEGIVLVTVHHAPSTLRHHLHDAHVDTQHVTLIDARGETPHDLDKQNDVHLVPSPTLLELIALRAQKLARRHDKPHLVVDDCEGLAFHNPAQAVEEYIRYVCTHVAPQLPVDFIRCEPSHLSPHLEAVLDDLLPRRTLWPSPGLAFDAAAQSASVA